MQFDLEAPHHNAITGYSEESIVVNGRPFAHSLLVGFDGLLQPWVAAVGAAPSAADLAMLAEQPYELVIVGTGATQHFPDPAALAPFMQRCVGAEIMTTPAACRTYNVLAAEGRRVLAALWLQPLKNKGSI